MGSGQLSMYVCTFIKETNFTVIIIILVFTRFFLTIQKKTLNCIRIEFNSLNASTGIDV